MAAIASPRSAPQSQHPRPKGPPDDVKKEVETIRKASGQQERLEATIRLASSIPLSKIAGWLDSQWFDVREGCEVRIFDSILRTRMIEGDLDAYLAWSAKSKRSEIKELLKSWASSDPQRLLDYFRAHPNATLEVDLLIVMGKSHPKLALERFGEILSGADRDKGDLNQLIEVLAASDPSGLAALESLMPPERVHWAEIRIASERLKSNFANNFPGLLNHPDGIAIFRNAMYQIPGSGDSLLDHLSALPPEWKNFMEQNAFEFSAVSDPERLFYARLEDGGISEKGAAGMRACALRAISLKDPEKALQLLGGFDCDPAQHADLLRSIVTCHGDDPARVQAMIASMNSEQDRETAQSCVHPQPASDPFRQRTPQEWMQEASAAGLSTLSYQAKETLARWSRDDIAVLDSAFRELPEDGKARAAKLIMKECSRDDNDFQALKAEAVAYLISHPNLPPDPFDQFATPQVKVSRQVEEWARTDATAAGDWLKTLPGAEERVAGEIALAGLWMNDDPQEAKRWIGGLAPDDHDKIVAALKLK